MVRVSREERVIVEGGRGAREATLVSAGNFERRPPKKVECHLSRAYTWVIIGLRAGAKQILRCCNLDHVRVA